ATLERATDLKRRNRQAHDEAPIACVIEARGPGDDAVANRDDADRGLGTACAHDAAVESLGGIPGARGERPIEEQVGDAFLEPRQVEVDATVEHRAVDTNLDFALPLGFDV